MFEKCRKYAMLTSCHPYKERKTLTYVYLCSTISRTMSQWATDEYDVFPLPQHLLAPRCHLV